MSNNGAHEPQRWIVVTNWDKFQHYTDRNPPWVKNYTELLHDPNYLDLTAVQRAALHGIWLEYASAHRQLRESTSRISRQLNLRVTKATLAALERAGWITFATEPQPLSTTWASRYISKELRRQVLDRDNHRCAECGSNKRLEIDHAVPISQGGTSEPNNLRTLCRSCNRSKHNRAVPHLSSNASSSGLSHARSQETETDKEKNVVTPYEARPEEHDDETFTDADIDFESLLREMP